MSKSMMNDGRFVVNSYDGKNQAEQTMPLEGLDAIEWQRYDHVTDLSRGKLAYRMGSGSWIELPLWTSLGKTPLNVLFALQLYAGHFVGCVDLVALTGNEYLLVPGNVSRHLVTLRKVHQEHWCTPWFFVTRRSGGFGVLWPAERTWIRIERIDPSVAGRTKAPTKPAA